MVSQFISKNCTNTNDFARNGSAILVNTHYMNEAEQSNRMCVMVAGCKVVEGSASEIKSAKACKLFVSSILQPVF